MKLIQVYYRSMVVKSKVRYAFLQRLCNYLRIFTISSVINQSLLWWFTAYHGRVVNKKIYIMEKTTICRSSFVPQQIAKPFRYSILIIGKLSNVTWE